MGTVVLIRGVLRGMEHETGCDVLARKHSVDSGSRYSEGFVLNAPVDLPDGEYFSLTFWFRSGRSKTKVVHLMTTDFFGSCPLAGPVAIRTIRVNAGTANHCVMRFIHLKTDLPVAATSWVTAINTIAPAPELPMGFTPRLGGKFLKRPFFRERPVSQKLRLPVLVETAIEGRGKR
jgi:hypothetical protein